MPAFHLTPTQWRRLRRTTQVLAWIAATGLIVAAPSAPGWASLPAQLDPLPALLGGLAGRTLIAGAGLALIVVLLTLLLGRVWCGWVCPLGSLLDWCGPRPVAARADRRFRLSLPPEGWRNAKYVLLVMLIGAALLGNTSLLWLDPITLFVRSLGGAIWPATGQAVDALEGRLYAFEWLWPALDAIHAALVYLLFRDAQPVYPHAVPVLLLLVAIVLLNGWTPRFWCRYLCPLGGLLGILAKGARVRRQVGPACQTCARCSPQCPMGTIDAHAGFRSDPAECTVCLDCVVDCPEQATSFTVQRPWGWAERRTYDPQRRTVLTGLGAAATVVALVAVEPGGQAVPANLLRPPGAAGDGFGDRCIRCGVCVTVCPTHALQTTLLEDGWRNLFTPRLVPRQGYCLYSCTACGEACPTDAIPLLSLAAKQQTPLGLARVDRDRCLPWAYATPCIVCEEMCPVPDKAIRLEEIAAVGVDGAIVTLQGPVVLKERCIGCGICEHKCPMGGEAAIRVFAQPLG
jgi:MauM/NapG family ferredoxin protein